jgi:hypothetical protein
MDWAKASQAMVRHERSEAKAKGQATTAGPALHEPPAAAHPPRRRPGVAATPSGPPQPLMALVGMPVVLHMRYGELVCGVLIKLYNYEMVVRTDTGCEIVAMKHAVDWIEPGTRP